MDIDLENKLSNCDSFFICPGTLKYISDEEMNLNIFSNVQSKIVELGYSVEDVETDDKYRAVGLVVKENKTLIHFFGQDLKVHLPRTIPCNIGDMFVFISSLKWKVESGVAEPHYFKIIEKPTFGSGSQKYRAQIVFSDTYFIDVYADSEEEAINTAYKIPMQNWTHDWPTDKELTRFQQSRQSLWGKKMISAKEYNA